MRDSFLLDPNIIFLNHGSFGATPRPVFQSYQRWQRELERQPVEFLGRRCDQLLNTAREELAAYLGTQRDNLVFITNATTGVNVVARGLKLGPGDEVLASDHEYGACDRCWQFLSESKGFHYVRQPVTIPIQSQNELIDDFWRGVTARTKVIFLSHITSCTAVIFPIKEICYRARQAGILTVIDGAHAPGQLELNLDDLGADFYTGNLHKWLCAPKGAAFLYVRPELQELAKPLIISWGWRSDNPGPSAFVDWHQWTGTRDISAFLTVPDAIHFLADNNWPVIQRRCHELAALARQELTNLTGLDPLYPDSENWYRQMGTVPLPNSVDIDKLKLELYERFRIEIPLIQWNNFKLLRFSLQAYNSTEDVNLLVHGVTELLIS